MVNEGFLKLTGVRVIEGTPPKKPLSITEFLPGDFVKVAKGGMLYIDKKGVMHGEEKYKKSAVKSFYMTEEYFEVVEARDLKLPLVCRAVGPKPKDGSPPEFDGPLCAVARSLVIQLISPSRIVKPKHPAFDKDGKKLDLVALLVETE